MRDQQAKAHVLKDYYQMTKPDINLLVILTTLGGIWMASSAPRPAGLVLATLLGTALASASAAVLNGYIDRDIDALMSRTRLRPLPTGRISPHHALLFGICLGVISFVLLVWQVNLLSAVLALGAILFYVGIYTAWLKRSTPMCTVIGGIPGAIPPVIGWAAVTGHVGLGALVLFAILFLWQPPHFWALTLYRKSDYARAGVPIASVAWGEAKTKRQILLYAFIMVAATLLLYPLKAAGIFYLASALILGLGFLGLSLAVSRTEKCDLLARRLFLYSVPYMGLLFLAMILDSSVLR